MTMIRCDCCKGMKQVMKLGMMGHDKCSNCKGTGQVKAEEPVKIEKPIACEPIEETKPIEPPAQEVLTKHKEVSKDGDTKKKARR